MKSPDKKFTVSTAPPLPLVSAWQLMIYWRPSDLFNIAPLVQGSGEEVGMALLMLVPELDVTSLVVAEVVVVNVAALGGSDIEAVAMADDEAWIDGEVEAAATVDDVACLVSEVEAAAVVDDVAWTELEGVNGAAFIELDEVNDTACTELELEVNAVAVVVTCTDLDVKVVAVVDLGSCTEPNLAAY